MLPADMSAAALHAFSLETEQIAQTLITARFGLAVLGAAKH